jgi:hypothetical protein
LSTNQRRRNRRRKAGDRLRTLAIILSSLGVWAGAFALIISGSDRGSDGAPIAPIHTDVAAPASDYAKMLQEIAARAPDYYGGYDGAASGNYNGSTNGKSTDASGTNAKAGARTHKASAANRPRVAVANPSIQAPTNQGLFSAPSSTLPTSTTTAGTTPASTSTTTTTVGNPGPTGPIISLDDSRLTPAQHNAAQALIDRTTVAMSLFPTEESVLDAGYVWIGDNDKNGYETYVNAPYLADGRELDAAHIESIVLQRDAAGTAKVVAAVYVLEPPKTMANVPDIAGALTTWQARNLCRAGDVFSPRLANGTCATGSLPVVLPSLPVWLVPNACGPFAGIAVDPRTCKPTSP